MHRCHSCEMPLYRVQIPAGKAAGSALPVFDFTGTVLRGYTEVPAGKQEGDTLEVGSDHGVLDFDAPGFPLFRALARQRGAYNDSVIPDGFDSVSWRRVRGRPCWLVCWALTFFVGGCVAAYFAPPRRLLHMLALYALTFSASAALVLSMWWEHRHELEPGVLVSIFWTSGTVCVGLAAMLNWCVLQLWPLIDPYCHPLHPLGKDWPKEGPSAACIAKASVEWVLMAGLIEESLKFLPLLRLVPSVADASAQCRFPPSWRCPESCVALCHWCRVRWVKLAPTPYALACAALASGGGLATVENFHYIFFDPEAFDRAIESGDLSHALGRILSSCAHIVWTGLAGIPLAQWHFLPRGHPCRPRYSWSGLIIPIIAHGLFDMCSVLRTCYPEEHCMEWPPESREWVCGHCVLPPRQRFVAGVCFQVLFVGSGLLFHHRWTHVLLHLSVESCRPLLFSDTDEATDSEIDSADSPDGMCCCWPGLRSMARSAAAVARLEQERGSSSASAEACPSACLPLPSGQY